MNILAGDVTEALRIRVRGSVQGVGFRPFVCRLARRYRLRGSVRNSAAGVEICVEGPREDLDRFRERLSTEAPVEARIEAVLPESVPLTGVASFVIDTSDGQTQPVVRLPRDLATCPECRRDILDVNNRRRGYPFTNCTGCGPRYSIIHAMPYDRAATAMRRFNMCTSCQREYSFPEDRRFHAQPNACDDCGPRVTLWNTAGESIAGAGHAIARAADLLRHGQIVALKGLGGFQLLVRADDPTAVQRLRQRKQRPSKPLAIMVPSLQAAEQVADLTEIERRLLQSAQNPIVLANKGVGAAPFADEIAPHVRTLGLMLPTTPLHHLLLAGLTAPVVATSGNRSEEPIVIAEGEALGKLAGIADAFLVHDRPIVRRVDDTVVRVIAGQEVVLRLGRGYVPLPLPALEHLGKRAPAILAVGGQQKGAVALWTGTQALLAQHIGDFAHHETRALFTEITRDLCALYQCEPEVIACDLHPDYFTTAWAHAQRRATVQVQHHHAHAVACMAQHDLLNHEVLAVVWDGTGHGTDGTIWGGEILRAACSGFRRVASLLPFPLPGGEAAIHHPNRAALGLLWVARGDDVARDARLLRRLAITPREASILVSMIRQGVNTPWTSSVGRLFDAAAALVLGIDETSYEGEAAVRFEAVARIQEEAYPWALPASACGLMAGEHHLPRGDWRPMVSAILDDLTRDVDPGIIAGRFHNALVGWVRTVAAQEPLKDVVLSGGCFQNRLLAEQMKQALAEVGRHAFLHASVPPGDGGLAVGQLAVALSRWR